MTSSAPAATPPGPDALAAFAARYRAVCDEVEKVMVGIRPVIEDVLIAILAEGNALLEGVPGLGKTRLVKALGDVLRLDFRRVQFTADLMPSDIIGTNLLVQDEHGKRLRFQRGPLFTNLLLADEINRATPKTQAALLEAMEEHSVTVGGVTNRLEEPFFVLATQNPIEQDGTYPLPLAQLDKFLFKLLVGYPDEAALIAIAQRTTGAREPEMRPVATGADIVSMRSVVRQVPVAAPIERRAVRLVRATDPTTPHATDTTRRYLARGSGPRGLLGLLHAAKAHALVSGRTYVAVEDLQSVALPVLRHRVHRTLEAEADGLAADDILRRLLDETRGEEE